MPPPPLPRSAPPPLPGFRPATAPLPAFDLRLLADLPSLTLQARYMMEGFLSGRHRSPQKGSSVEFAEYRDYQPGDDLRRVDWRLYGRTDRLHVKQYEEETQLRIFLVFDLSASMDFRSRPELLRKVEFARVTLAALGLLAQRQGDAFGLGVAGMDLNDFLRARASVPHWRAFVGRLEYLVPGGRTNLRLALEALAELIPRRSIVMIASDFYDDLPELGHALRRLRYDKHEIVGLQVLDPQEVDFAWDASGTFVDAESGARLLLDAPSVRKGYLQRFQAFRTELDDLFRGHGGEVTLLRTDEAPFRALAEYLARRERRKK